MLSDRDFYSSSITEAVEMVGDYDMLALIVNVDLHDLMRWARGEERPPTDAFLRIVDLVRKD